MLVFSWIDVAERRLFGALAKHQVFNEALDLQTLLATRTLQRRHVLQQVLILENEFVSFGVVEAGLTFELRVRSDGKVGFGASALLLVRFLELVVGLLIQIQILLESRERHICFLRRNHSLRLIRTQLSLRKSPQFIIMSACLCDFGLGELNTRSTSSVHLFCFVSLTFLLQILRNCFFLNHLIEL